MRKRKPFTLEQKNFIIDNYFILGPDAFVLAFNLKYNTNYDREWAIKTASRLHCSSKEGQEGYYSAIEAGYLLGVTRTSILARIKLGTIAATSSRNKGKYFISEDEMDRLIKEKQKTKEPIPWPYYTIKQAQSVLGMSNGGSLYMVIGRGYLDSVKRGSIHYVKKEQIDWGLKQMKDHGFTKIPWYKMKERTNGK